MNTHQRFFALTIDKAKTDVPPTLEDYNNVFNALCLRCDLAESHYPVHSYEYKTKGKKGINKTHKWIHFHACVYTGQYIDYRKIKTPGYSTVLRELKTPMDILNWCGYVQKEMAHQVHIFQYRNSLPTLRKIKKKNLKKKRKVIKILDFIEGLNIEDSLSS